MRFTAICLAVLTMVSFGVCKDEFVASSFVRQQLNSIGTDRARNSVKNRYAEGAVSYEVVNGGPTRWEGVENFASEDEKVVTLLKFPPSNYLTEWFVQNHKKVAIAPIRPGRWSAFGNFVKVHDEILTEGLWGGTLSTGWALSRWEENHAKLTDRGLKKMDGRELRRVDYDPGRATDLEIQLYFEPDTFRHVATVYLLYYQPLNRVVERFSDFSTVNNLTLPRNWTIEFTTRAGRFDRFKIRQEKISHNVKFSPNNFDAP
jgi:hypothetical protein